MWAAAPVGPGAGAASDRARSQATLLISRARDGGLPNGASTNAVISGDRRWARVIAYRSGASNLVPRDTNGSTDVFAIRGAGRFSNRGTTWKRGHTRLVSHARGGGPANGAPAVDGALRRVPFLMTSRPSGSTSTGVPRRSAGTSRARLRGARCSSTGGLPRRSGRNGRR